MDLSYPRAPRFVSLCCSSLCHWCTQAFFVPCFLVSQHHKNPGSHHIGCIEFSVILCSCVVFCGLPINRWCPSTLKTLGCFGYLHCAWLIPPLCICLLVFCGLPINRWCPGTQKTPGQSLLLNQLTGCNVWVIYIDFSVFPSRTCTLRFSVVYP